MKKRALWRIGLLVLFLLALLATAGCGSDAAAEPEEDTEASEEQMPEEDAPEEGAEEGADEAAADASEAASGTGAVPATPDDASQPPEPAPAPVQTPEAVPEDEIGSGDLERELRLTLSEALAYMRSLQPSLLGLAGEDMGIYEILPNQFIVPVNGLLCSELMVYNKDETSGTNVLVGIYLISRGEERKLYRVDQETGDVVELPLTAGAAEGTEEPAPQETPQEAPQEAPEEAPQVTAGAGGG